MYILGSVHIIISIALSNGTDQYYSPVPGKAMGNFEFPDWALLPPHSVIMTPLLALALLDRTRSECYTFIYMNISGKMGWLGPLRF